MINTSADADHTSGNETVSQAGMTVNGNPADIIAHEAVLARMTETNRPITERPLKTYFEDGRDFSFNGEAILLYHFNGHTAGDSLVYFRGSDVVVSGDLFLTTTFPTIDLEAGGSVDGLIAGLNKTLDITVPKYLQEGGTYVIPGHGRISDEADVLEFRDMVVIIRDRIQDLVKKGMTLDQVKAARPALDYEGRYGAESGAKFIWGGEAFAVHGVDALLGGELLAGLLLGAEEPQRVRGGGGRGGRRRRRRGGCGGARGRAPGERHQRHADRQRAPPHPTSVAPAPGVGPRPDHVHG